MVDVAKFIDDLGGRDAVSHLTGAKPNAITQWRRDGIPAKYWIDLIDAAARLGIENINKATLQATWPQDRGKRRPDRSAEAPAERSAA